MSRKKPALFVVLALLLAGVATMLAAAAFQFPQPTYPKTYKGIEPDGYPGNFVSSDGDQVCYDLSALGYLGEVTEEMRGFRVDPPNYYNDGNVEVIVSADTKYLAWESTNATVLAFVVKGGPNYHVYDYVDSDLTADSWLASPLNTAKKIPQIGHYNVCYQPEVSLEGNGCTPGYWRNHYDRWSDYTADQSFDTVFDITYLGATVTLGMAIDNPDTYRAFAFHAVAALLNSTGGVPNKDGTTVDYPYSTAEVIQMVQDAVANGTIVATQDLFEAANELGCPLSGTAACSTRNPQACLH